MGSRRESSGGTRSVWQHALEQARLGMWDWNIQTGECSYSDTWFRMLGYEPGEPDGVVGQQTTAAIKAFQKEAGLTADGSIDETLIRALLARKDG